MLSVREVCLVGRQGVPQHHAGTDRCDGVSAWVIVPGVRVLGAIWRLAAAAFRVWAGVQA